MSALIAGYDLKYGRILNAPGKALHECFEIFRKKFYRNKNDF